MKSLRRCVLSAGALALATAGGAQEARAAGFAATNIGGEQGNVVGTNPLALFYNPGAMAFAKGSQLAVYGQLAIRDATYIRPAASTDKPDPPGAEGANTGTAHLLNVFGGPSIGGTLKVGNLMLGAGFFAPFYGRQHWDKNSSFVDQPALLPDGTKNPRVNYPLAAGGVQRWFSIDGAMSILYFTAGAAYRLGPLAIGATGNFISSTVNSTNANSPYNMGADTSHDGRAFVDAHTFNGSFAAGLMLEAVPHQLWIGASYQAQPGFGEQSLRGQLVLTSPVNGGRTFDVDFRQTLPAIYRAGIKWRPGGNGPVELRLFGDRTGWSAFKSQCVVIHGIPCSVNADGSDNTPNASMFAFIPHDWKDTYGARLGVSVWPTREIELLVGGGYETAASPDSTLAPDSPDANTVQGSLGIRYMATESLYLTASYTQIQSFDRNNVGKSTLAVNAAGLPVSYPTLKEDAGGEYKSWVGLVTGNIEALF